MPPNAKHGPFKHPTFLERQYDERLRRLFDRYTRMPKKATLSELADFIGKFGEVDSILEPAAERIASQMVTGVSVHNARGWKAAASKSTQGRTINDLLQTERRGVISKRIDSLISHNVVLIRSVPSDVAAQAMSFITAQSERGVRSSTIADYLQERLQQYTRSTIERLARTGASSANTALTRARSERLEVFWYQWETSEDARVRPSHANLDHVLVNWNDAPAPEALIGIKSTLGHYQAGNCPLCRCVPLPIIDLDELRWPCRVYSMGAISRMGRSRFLSMSGYKLPVAA